MTSPLRKGSVTGKFSLEAKFSQGLTAAPISVAKNKAHGGDIGMCFRKSVLHCFLPDTFLVPIEPSAFLYMSIGTAMHQAAEKAYGNAGILVGNEVPFEIDFIGPPRFKPLKGYVDMIIRDHDDELAIVDIKTCGGLPNKLKGWHGEQVAVYCLMTGISRGYIHYVSRNVANFKGELQQKAFEVDLTVEQMRRIAKRVAMAHVYMQSAMIPKIPSHLESKSDCGFCPFQEFCWDDGPSVWSIPEVTDSKAKELNAEALTLAKQLITTMPDRFEKFVRPLL